MSLPILAAALLPVAYDVDLAIEAPGADPIELHLVEVSEGPLPAVYLPTEDGGWIVDIELHLIDGDTARFDIEVVRQELGRFGRLSSELVSRPKVTTRIGEPALIRQSARIPLPDGGFEDVDVLGVEATLHN